MKIILLRMKMFFVQQHVKIFIKMFSISFPLILGGMYIFMENRSHFLSGSSKKNFIKEFNEIIKMPRSTNQNIIVEIPYYGNRNYQNEGLEITNKNFWSGDALNYRYTVPQKGIPRN